MALITSNAFAGDEEMWGTYRLLSSTKKYLDTGEVVSTFGEHPKGYITYGKEGRMLTLITYDGRKKPENALEATVEQRDALFGSMVAYGGTYTYSGNRVEHHIDIWWNESWNGTTVIRSITRDGDRLVYVTEPFPDRAEKTKGKMVFTTLIWEKVR